MQLSRNAGFPIMWTSSCLQTFHFWGNPELCYSCHLLRSGIWLGVQLNRDDFIMRTTRSGREIWQQHATEVSSLAEARVFMNADMAPA